MILGIIGLIALLILAVMLFVNYYPSFGGDVDEERQKQYSNSAQFGAGVFKNKRDVPEQPSLAKTLNIAWKFFFQKVENGRPQKDLAIKKVDSTGLADYSSGTRLIWFGHSAFLLQLGDKNVLIDPMFGPVPAPHPWLGAKRFSEELPIEVEKLPRIDALVISHDHYDHLDYESIRKLKDKVDHFIVPLGVGVHLEAWGVDKSLIEELDWWEETGREGINFVCTPAQHFSGRKFNNGQTTLWSSWVIQTDSANLFFSGDSGYGPHFKEIGEKYGPFEFAMLECGQYNKMWPDIHMFPEETAQAGLDVKARAMMPIHWGAFKLALHSWTDPVERVSRKAKDLGVTMALPRIGEVINIPYQHGENSSWWEAP